jgi:transposase-like protein
MTYFHETFGKRNRIERWFREMKYRKKEVLQQRELEEFEELRRVGNRNCSDAQRHQGRRRGGNTNLTVPGQTLRSGRAPYRG